MAARLQSSRCRITSVDDGGGATAFMKFGAIQIRLCSHCWEYQDRHPQILHDNIMTLANLTGCLPRASR